MAGDVLYIDSSALVKLILAEAHSAEVAEVCAEWPIHATSVVAPVEVGLAVRRALAQKAVRARADRVLASVDLVPLDPEIVEWARHEASPKLRALDAIHVGSALYLGASLGAFVTYDRRQREAARAAGLQTLPS